MRYLLSVACHTDSHPTGRVAKPPSPIKPYEYIPIRGSPPPKYLASRATIPKFVLPEPANQTVVNRTGPGLHPGELKPLREKSMELIPPSKEHTKLKSYVNAAAGAGYATLAYNRLGVGNSDHPDPI